MLLDLMSIVLDIVCGSPYALIRTFWGEILIEEETSFLNAQDDHFYLEFRLPRRTLSFITVSDVDVRETQGTPAIGQRVV